MKPSVKREWLKALRSGEYTKARERLHNRRRNSYCCLGVLQCLVGREYTDTGGTLGIDNLNKVGMTHDQQSRLTSLNDRSAGWEAVCKYIEEEL